MNGKLYKTTSGDELRPESVIQIFLSGVPFGFGFALHDTIFTDDNDAIKTLKRISRSTKME